MGKGASKVIHLDMDSFFATAEQQCRPHLRGKPVGITPTDTRNACVIAASREAKRKGVKTGVRLVEARLLIPDLVTLRPDPPKYREIHRGIRRIMEDYSPEVKPRSIDEMALWLSEDLLKVRSALSVGEEIKARIRSEIGEHLSASIGIGPNWWLAKTAAGYRKPDGLFELTRENTRDVMKTLKLQDLCGIARRMEARMLLQGIATPVDLYDKEPWELKRMFGINGYYWYRRLHGMTIDTEGWPTKSVGHSSVIPIATGDVNRLLPLAHKLCEKVGWRLRKNGWVAKGLAIYGRDQDYHDWGASLKMSATNDSGVLWRFVRKLFDRHPPRKALKLLAITSLWIQEAEPAQLSLFGADERRRAALDAYDRVNYRWGDFTVHPAGMFGSEGLAGDSVGFAYDLTKAHR